MRRNIPAHLNLIPTILRLHHRPLPPKSQPPVVSPSPPPTLSLPPPSPKPSPVSKPPSPPKKSPPIPWSHQETLALIQAYQEKWYSLNKGQLKAFQWEEVVAAVASLCGFDEPSKTSTQCRHKIEKLRKRYRAELQKPYPDSWQYFQLMDQMERGPTPLPVAVFKSPPSTYDRSTSNNLNPRYANVYSASADYRGNFSRVDGGESDESDEEWNAAGYGVEATKRNKSKSINNILHCDTRTGVRHAKRGGFSGEGHRFIGVSRNQMNGKRKECYGGDDSSGDDDDDDDDDLAEEKYDDLAAEIRSFAESFMRMENKKIEMMREKERYRMEMEKKRTEMILGAQRKIADTIGRAFGTNKKPRVAQDT